MIEALSRAVSHRRHGEMFIAASIGIAVFPADGTDAEELLQHADTAMYRAKERAAAHTCSSRSAMNREALRARRLDRELRRALERGEFVLALPAAARPAREPRSSAPRR